MINALQVDEDMTELLHVGSRRVSLKERKDRLHSSESSLCGFLDRNRGIHSYSFAYRHGLYNLQGKGHVLFFFVPPVHDTVTH